jgi:hypothetical protein
MVVVESIGYRTDTFRLLSTWDQKLHSVVECRQPEQATYISVTLIQCRNHDCVVRHAHVWADIADA